MFTKTFSPSGQDGGEVRVIEASDLAHADFDPGFLFNADFLRLGDDLLLRGDDGEEILLRGYFAENPPPSLTTSEGARLTAEMVEGLAVPEAPLAYVQVGNPPLGQPIGEVNLLDGIARVQRADGTRENLSAGDPVFQGDVVSTGFGSELGIVFIDETIFSLSANARMVIDELIYNPSSTANSMGVSLIQGTFVFITGEIAPTGAMEVQTPGGIIGIRGTTVGIQITSLAGFTTIANLANPVTGDVGTFEFSNDVASALFSLANHFLQIPSATSDFGQPTIASVQQIGSTFGQPVSIAVDVIQNISQEQNEEDADPGEQQEGELQGEPLQNVQEANSDSLAEQDLQEIVESLEEAGLTPEQIEAALNEPVIEAAAGPEPVSTTRQSGEGADSGTQGSSPQSNGSSFDDLAQLETFIGDDASANTIDPVSVDPDGLLDSSSRVDEPTPAPQEAPESDDAETSPPPSSSPTTAPTLATNGTNGDEGDPIPLTSAQLLASDAETTDPAQLSYSVTETSRGFAALDVAAPGNSPDYQLVLNFTQADVDAGRVYFIHDGSESGAASFKVTVSDPDGGVSSEATIPIAITPVNDPPVLTTNALSVLAGETVVLAPSDLTATDPDDDNVTLEFTVSGVSGGQFELTGTPGVAVIFFTQQQVIDAEVVFVDDGDGVAPAYSVSVGDGLLASAPAAASVNFTPSNQPPAALDDAVTTDEDTALVGDVLADNGNGVDSDPESDPMTVTAVNGALGEVGNEITLASGALLTLNDDGSFDYDPNGAFEDLGDGESDVDIFTYTISDGEFDDDATVTVSVIGANDAPQLTANSLTVSEGGTMAVGLGDLAATDADDTDAMLTFTVSEVSGGQFEMTDNPGVAVTSFIQQQVIDGELVFVDDGDEVPPGYSVSVSDSLLATVPAPAAITFIGVNDDPVVTSGAALVVKGASLQITASILSASDAETADPALLSFAVSSEIAGQVLISGVVASSFTLADIQGDLVTFQHDDSAGALAGFTVVAGDSNGGASAPVALEFQVAAGFVWTNAGGDGDWDNPANWASNAVPGDGAVVLIEDQAGAVTFSSGAVALQSLNLNGESLNLTGGSLDVGDLTWTAGALGGAGGSLSSGGASVIGGSAPLTLDRDLVLSGSGELAGTLQGAGGLVNEGALTIAAGAEIAVSVTNQPAGEIVVDGGGGGAALTLSGVFQQLGVVILTSTGATGEAGLVVSGAPFDNQGTVVVEAGIGGARSIEADLVNNGDMTFDAVTTITGAGGQASNEAGAILTANADVTVIGVASFRNSGSMTVATAAAFALVGADFENALGGVIGGSGTIDVTGGTFTNNGTINPGSSPGMLTVDGDFMQSADGVFTVEVDGTGGDGLNVTGTADFAGLIEIVLLDGFIPLAGETLNFVMAGQIIDSGATVTGLDYAGGLFGVQLDGGTASLVAISGSGDTFVDPYEIIVGDTASGSLTVDAGQSLHSQYLSVGEEATGLGTFILTNTSTLTIEGASYIANFGDGDATISGGAQVSLISNGLDNLIVAGEPGSNGSLVIEGAGSVVTTIGSDNTVKVGLGGSGEMSVQGGAELNTLWLEVGRSGNGTVVIQGAGSEVTISNDEGRYSGDSDPFAGTVTVGRNDGSIGSLSVLGQALLEIRNGQGVNEDTIDPELIIARNTGSQGTLVVDGAGSMILISQAAPADQLEPHGPIISVGRGGVGSLIVQNGGLIDLSGGSPWISIGNQAGGDGAIVVEGADSAMIIDGEFGYVSIGGQGAGSLTVSDSAQFSLTGPGGTFQLGNSATSSGQLLVTGGAQFSIEGEAIFGYFGSSEATISGGAQATFASDNFDNLLIGNVVGSTSALLIEDVGTVVTTTGTDNTVQVGFGGTGEMIVQGGAILCTLFLELGRNGQGTTIIQGSGTLVTASNDEGRFGGDFDFMAGFVRVGNNAGSQGTLEVLDGARLEIRNGNGVNEDTAEPGLQIANQDGSLGTVLIDGIGSIIEMSQTSPVDPDNGVFGPFVQIGRGGNGSLTIQNGGQFSMLSDRSSLNLGRDPTGQGSLYIDGAGSTLLLSGSDVSLQVGRDGIGSLSVLNGGQIEMAGDQAGSLTIAALASGNGMLLVDGAQSSITMTGIDPYVGVGHSGQGAFTLSNEALVSLDGPGINFEIARENGAVGTLAIQSGAVLSIYGGDGDSLMKVGTFFGSQGIVTVEGAGSMLSVGGANLDASFNNRIDVGREGFGQLTTLNGGLVVAERLNIAWHPLGVGIGLVDNASWEIGAGGLHVGLVGDGTLTIQDGGTVSVDPGFSSIASSGGSVGEVNVHAASSLSYAGFLSVGNGFYDPMNSPDFGQDAAAFGTLNILGGTVTAQDANLGGEVRGDGTVIIDGAGALFQVTGGLTIAAAGSGHLTVGDGGTLQVGVAEGDGIPDIFINSGGTLEILAGGTVVGDIQNNGGTLINGNSPGIASFGGDFVMTGGTLEVELGGTEASDFDLYQVQGQADLSGGLLEFSILEGYDPLAGDFFGFLTAEGGLTTLKTLSFVMRGVAESFDFEVILSENEAGLTVLNDAGAGEATIFRGGAGDDVFTGGAGNDLLDGGAGSDTLSGGAGRDAVVLRAGEDAGTLSATDVFADFEDGIDLFVLEDGLSYDDLRITDDGAGNAVISDSLSGAQLIVVLNSTAAQITEEDLATGGLWE